MRSYEPLNPDVSITGDQGRRHRDENRGDGYGQRSPSQTRSEHASEPWNDTRKDCPLDRPRVRPNKRIGEI